MVKMVKESENSISANPTYAKWILDAISKIKHQKQRPCVDRICHAVRQFHKVSRESIEEQLELSVKEGSILRVYNKGVASYKDPSRVTRLKSRVLHLDKKCDLTKVVVRSIRDLGDNGGSTIKEIEKYIRTSYTIDQEDEVELLQQIRLAVKRGITRSILLREGRCIKLNYEHASNCESDSVGSTSSSGSIPAMDDDLSSDTSFTFEKEKVIINVTHIISIGFPFFRL